MHQHMQAKPLKCKCASPAWTTSTPVQPFLNSVWDTDAPGIHGAEVMEWQVILPWAQPVHWLPAGSTCARQPVPSSSAPTLIDCHCSATHHLHIPLIDCHCSATHHPKRSTTGTGCGDSPVQLCVQTDCRNCSTTLQQPQPHLPQGFMLRQSKHVLPNQTTHHWLSTTHHEQLVPAGKPQLLSCTCQQYSATLTAPLRHSPGPEWPRDATARQQFSWPGCDLPAYLCVQKPPYRQPGSEHTTAPTALPSTGPSRPLRCCEAGIAAGYLPVTWGGPVGVQVVQAWEGQHQGLLQYCGRVQGGAGCSKWQTWACGSHL